MVPQPKTFDSGAPIMPFRSQNSRRAVYRFALFACLLVASPAWLHAEPQGAQNASKMIDVGGLKLRAQIAGQARAGKPAVVFAGGLGDSREIWKLVQTEVA
jgi:hypothetical protein